MPNIFEGKKYPLSWTYRRHIFLFLLSCCRLIRHHICLQAFSARCRGDKTSISLLRLDWATGTNTPTWVGAAIRCHVAAPLPATRVNTERPRKRKTTATRCPAVRRAFIPAARQLFEWLGEKRERERHHPLLHVQLFLRLPPNCCSRKENPCSLLGGKDTSPWLSRLTRVLPHDKQRRALIVESSPLQGLVATLPFSHFHRISYAIRRSSSKIEMWKCIQPDGCYGSHCPQSN